MALRAETEVRLRAGVSDRVRNYNLRLGALQLDLAGSMTVTFDDNPAGSSANPQPGVALEYGTEVGVYWPIRKDFTLDSVVYIGRHDVLSGAGEAGWLVRAVEGTGLALDMKVGDSGLLSLSETLNMDVQTLEGASGTGTSAQWMGFNQLALQYENQLSRNHLLALRVGEDDLWALSPEFSYRGLRTQYAAGKHSWHLTRDEEVGPYASFRMHTHPQKQHNDADEYELGLMFQSQLTRRTHLELQVGYQVMNFSTANVPETTDQGATPTGKISVVSQITRSMSHGITLKYFDRMGTARDINYSEDIVAAYRYNWDLSRRWYFVYLFNWVHSTYSGSGDSEQWLSNEFQLGYRVKKWSMFGGYRRTDRLSYMTEREYTSNQVTLGVNYDF